MPIIRFSAVAACLLGSALSAQESGMRLVEVPNPLSGENPLHRLLPRPVPEVGKPFRDARFGTKLMRVTQEKGLRHEYARHDAFNRDQTLILVVNPKTGDRRVYDTSSVPYDGRGNLVRAVDMEEPRWDAEDAKMLWGFQGFRIVKQNARSGEITVVKDFATDPKVGPILKSERDLYRITTKEEGEPSRDKRFWAFFLQGAKEDYRSRYIVCWDRKLDAVVGWRRLAREESAIDWVGMSPLGNWVLIGGDWDNGGKLTGLILADRTLSAFHRLDYTTAHGDVGLDSDGNEVIVMQNTRTDYIDLLPLDPKTKPILESGGSYKGANRTPLMKLHYSSGSPSGLNSGVHVSCNVPGYCVVSTYTEPKRREQNWLDRSVVLVKLDPRRPRVFYLAKLHNTTKTYWEETHATITNDGAKIVWATNWGENVGNEQTFLMLLEMPANWRKQIE